MHPRRHARVKPAGIVSRQAKIITDPRAPVIVCTLIDYSPGGACVDLGGQVKIPDRFELLHVNQLNETTLASPALLDGRWYWRTQRHLLCIGKR